MTDKYPDCSCHEAYDEHQEDYECRFCGRCIWAEPMLTGKYDDYDEKPICIECALKEDKDLTIEEVAGLFD